MRDGRPCGLIDEVNWHDVIDERSYEMDQVIADVLRREPAKLQAAVAWIERFLADPSLYNNLNDTATMVNKILPRLDRAMRDVEVFADKLACHPELLGIGGAVRPSSGVKESHSVIPWRY